MAYTVRRRSAPILLQRVYGDRRRGGHQRGGVFFVVRRVALRALWAHRHGQRQLGTVVVAERLLPRRGREGRRVFPVRYCSGIRFLRCGQ